MKIHPYNNKIINYKQKKPASSPDMLNKGSSSSPDGYEQRHIEW